MHGSGAAAPRGLGASALLDRDLFDQHGPRGFLVGGGQLVDPGDGRVGADDLAEQGEVRWQAGFRADGDEEPAAGVARRPAGLPRHRDHAFAVPGVGGWRLDDAVAGAAGAVALRVAAVDREAGDGFVEIEAFVEALAGEVDERVDRLRRPADGEGDVEDAAARVHDRDQLLPLLHGLFGRRQADLLRLRRGDLPAAGHVAAGGRVAAATAAAGQDCEERGGERREHGDDDPPASPVPPHRRQA